MDSATSIVTTEHIRHHVIEDAGDLISLVGLLDPVVTAPQLKEPDDIAHAGRLIRKLLGRDLILILCRLHEVATEGPTGITASVEALLDYASGDVRAERILELRNKRKQIISDLEANGINSKTCEPLERQK